MKTYGVVDTETTGMDPAEDRLVEIAVVREDGSFSHSLVCPGERRISFGAMAAHHITNEMVADAPSALDALAILGLTPPSDDWGGHPEVLVFHNAEFDRGFLSEWLRDLPWICTWRCALHLFPHAESHKNGSLWYELGLNHEMPPEAGNSSHRALFDALMTRDILEHMVELCLADPTIVGSEEDADRTPASCLAYLVWLSKQPVLLTKCRFGKHRDELWSDVPTRYMEWLLGENFDEDTKHTCRHWLLERGRL